jgi:hypothetical protein
MSVSSINWLPILIVFVAPLAFGTTLMFAAFRLRKKWARWTTGMAGGLFILTFLAAVVWFAPYMWASHLESRWHPTNPKTKTELESFLSLYSQRDIQPSESGWGSNHQLQPGERMTQYLLLWNAPLDVVYTSNDTIVAIYTSYE